MRFEDLTYAPRLVRLPEAERYVGGACNLKALRKGGFVKPVREHKANTTFDIKHLDAAVDRAELEGWPE